jgi:plasmid stabilization system protein ParE
MVKEVIWSKNSEKDFIEIITYLTNKWSINSAIKFRDLVYFKIEILSKQPMIGIQSNKVEVIRKILITKHTYLYYALLNHQIVLLGFFDVRQNPLKNIFE